MDMPRLPGVDRHRRLVRLRRELPASPGALWQALTEPGRLAAWLGRVDEGRPAPGSPFAIRHDETTRSRHTVTEWEPEQVLGLTWNFPAEVERGLFRGVSPRCWHRPEPASPRPGRSGRPRGGAGTSTSTTSPHIWPVRTSPSQSSGTVTRSSWSATRLGAAERPSAGCGTARRDSRASRSQPERTLVRKCRCLILS